jgi:hypothetical protein
MRKLFFYLSAIALAGLVSINIFSQTKRPLPPPPLPKHHLVIPEPPAPPPPPPQKINVKIPGEPELPPPPPAPPIKDEEI